jgi:hypothetical protein
MSWSETGRATKRIDPMRPQAEKSPRDTEVAGALFVSALVSMLDWLTRLV